MRATKGIAQKVADKICGPHNQNATMIFVGGTGSGKSLAAVSLALEVSKLVAEKKGGKPEDYFQLESNMSVIDVENFFEVLKNAKRFSTVIFDDAGIGYNARKFQDIVNITLNNITQVYRTLNLFSILTTPNFFFIDKVGRTLTEWYCEMEGVFDKLTNVSRGRMFEVQTHSRLGSHGKIFYVYPRAENGYSSEKNYLCTFQKPPEELCVAYEKLRREGAAEYQRKSIEMLKERKEGSGNKNEHISKTKQAEVCLQDGLSIMETSKSIGLAISSVKRLSDTLKTCGAI